MLGRTHYKIGLFYYCIVACLLSGLGFSAFGFGKITLFGVIFAAIGGLFPDIDHESSTLRTGNRVFRILEQSRVINFIAVCYLVFFIVGFVAMPVMYFRQEGAWEQLKATPLDKIFSQMVAYLVIIGIIILFVKFRKQIKTRLIPMVSIFFLFFYILNAEKIDLISFLMLGFIFAASVFPHRTFTHSVEGFICYSFCAIYMAARLELAYIGFCFSLGYFTHLWLADIFTNGGIYISYVVNLLGEKNIIGKENILYKALGKKHSLCSMIVGSKRGQMIERVYVLISAVVAVIMIAINLPNFSII